MAGQPQAAEDRLPSSVGAHDTPRKGGLRNRTEFQPSSCRDPLTASEAGSREGTSCSDGLGAQVEAIPPPWSRKEPVEPRKGSSRKAKKAGVCKGLRPTGQSPGGVPLLLPGHRPFPGREGEGAPGRRGMKAADQLITLEEGGTLGPWGKLPTRLRSPQAHPWATPV